MTQSAAHKQPSRDDESTDETPVEVQVAQLREAMTKMLRAGDGDGVIDALLEIIARQHHDIAHLGKHVKVLTRLLFGRRSEKLSAEELGQLALAFGATPELASQPEPLVPQPDELEEKDADGAEPKPDGEKKPRGSKKGRHPGRSRLDPKLPRNVTLHFVPAGERACIHCQSEMQPVGHVDHERVQYIPARIEVDVDRCEKIACMTCQQDIAVAARPGAKPRSKAGQSIANVDQAAACAGVNEQADEDVTPVVAAEQIEPACASAGAAKTTPHESTVAPGAHVYRRAGASLLAHLLEAKADDALPIYRQRQQFARLGFDAPLNTLYGYWDTAARMVQPVADIVLSEILGHDIIALDDTRLDWLDPKADRKRRRGHLWCFMGTSPLVAFQFTKSWCADEVAPWIECTDAFIQCGRVESWRGTVRRRGVAVSGSFRRRRCLSSSRGPVSSSRHFERSVRISRTTLTAEASSHRGYGSF